MRASSPSELAGRPATARIWVILGGIAVVLAAVSIPVNAVLYGVPVIDAILLGLIQAGLIPLAVRSPKIAAALSLIPFVLLALLGNGSVGAPWPVAVTSILAQIALIITLAFASTWRTAALTWLGSVLAVIALIAATPQRYDRFTESLASAIPFAAISLALLTIALLLAQRARIRAQLERERRVTASEQVRRELMEERNRIARELHDVVAHGLSMIQVQASSAKYRLPDLAPEAAAEFDSIGATSRGALAEMRQLLGVLRNEDSAAGLGPQPGLMDIPELVKSIQKTGVAVDLRWSVDDSDGLPASISLTAYRLVQEALSNAVRHAAGASATVVVTRASGAIDLMIENEAPRDSDPASPAATPRPGGHGLVGMRERVQLAGGRIDLGPTDSGGFRVAAHLPIPNSTERA
ncbi:signal transduction histidine kinase [Mycetocola sp. BIGb0189]|uniref:sensor histidine kinase n=1 Tax=Mycetocola sp. BIGb0189 TaxID=2940604 RepID=UPI002168CC94|nr:sensor histidine kinase [Mycetocola sp. BIGb0189]MCS4275176.1 signal transduction histidine kinase [Mycetocola sp. BIGb0189]